MTQELELVTAKEKVALRPVPQSKTNRVVVRGDFVHCPDGLEMKGWSNPHSYLIQSREQAYERFLDVDEEWRPVSFGWILEPSLVYVKNMDDTTGDGGRGVDLAYDVMDQFSEIAVVRPGRDCRFEPVRFNLFARSRRGSVRVQVVALPR